MHEIRPKRATGAARRRIFEDTCQGSEKPRVYVGVGRDGFTSKSIDAVGVIALTDRVQRPKLQCDRLYSRKDRTGTMSWGKPVLTSCAGRPVAKMSCGLSPSPLASCPTSAADKLARNCGAH